MKIKIIKQLPGGHVGQTFEVSEDGAIGISLYSINILLKEGFVEIVDDEKEILLEIMKKYYFEAREVIIIDTGHGYRVDVYYGGLAFPCISLPYECIIFSIEFAKSLWGTKCSCGYYEQSHNCCGCDLENKDCNNKEERWQKYIKRMVIEKNRIKYLKQFI